MTIQNLESELLSLNEKIRKIFNETNYSSLHNLSTVSYAPDCPDDVMKYLEFQSIFSHLDFVYSLLTYLQKPIECTEIIERTPHGRYKIGNTILCVADIIEILSTDEESGSQYWHPRVIKPSSTDLVGKTARFRDKLPPHIH